jgi:hypothetical protein
MQRALWVLIGCVVLAGAVWLIQPGARSDDKKDDKGTVVEIDGLSSRTPADWKEEKPKNNLRIKQFRLPKADGDKDDADLGISHVPAGGALEDNIKRWKAMFAAPEGKTIDDVFKHDKMTVGDVPVQYIDIRGTYKGASFEKIEPKPDHRMLMIVFESKGGPYYFRLVGPAKTVEAHKKGFDEWLKNFKK